MALPRSSAGSGMVYGIVVGGHDDDPDPNEAGNLRVYFPGIHGNDVDISHLSLSPRIMSPTRSGQQEFPGGLDPGSLVIAMKDTGSNYCQIIGLANDINNSETAIPGNTDLMGLARAFLSTTVNVRVPPNISEVMEGDVRVRRAQEKGTFHSHNLFQGIPTNGALYSMSGSIVPRVSGISTAATPFGDGIGQGLLDSLPGVFMTLGKMFSLLGQLVNGVSRLFNIQNHHKTNGRSDIANAINSISFLTQAVSSMNRGGFNVGGRVDQDSFLDNAESLLKQAVTIADVSRSLSGLQSNRAYWGHDKLGHKVLVRRTAHGIDKSFSISPTGSIMQFLPKGLKAKINQALGVFETLGKLISLIPGMDPSISNYARSAKKIWRMLNRLTPLSLAFMILKFTLQEVSGRAITEKAISGTTHQFAFIPGAPILAVRAAFLTSWG